MAANTPAPGKYTVDPSHSTVEFVARHMMVTKVRGQFAEVSGTVEVAEDPTRSTVEASAVVSSLTTRDAQRDGHLLSADFFDADNHKSLEFRSTSIEPNGDDWKLNGELTIRGITKPVSFELEYTGAGKNPYGVEVAGFEATTTVNRKDWELNWNVALEAGGVLVSEKVQIILDIQLHRQA